MNRRELLLLLGGAMMMRRVALRAQQKAMPVIGYPWSHLARLFAPYCGRFPPRTERNVGYVEGQNLAIEYRWAEDRYDRLPALAADLVRRKVDLIAARLASLRTSGEKCDLHDPDRLHHRRRPGRDRPGRQPRAGRAATSRASTSSTSS